MGIGTRLGLKHSLAIQVKRICWLDFVGIAGRLSYHCSHGEVSECVLASAGTLPRLNVVQR